MLGEGQCQDEKIPKGPTALLRAYQSNSFNNFYLQLSFFVIVRQRTPAVASVNVKQWEQIL